MQADHRWELNKKILRYSILFTKDRVDIFNAIKLPNKYKKFATEKLDNVNASRLINSIILDTEPILLEKKTFFGYYEFQNSKTTVKLICMKIKFLKAFIVIFLFQTNSYAYLDPGSSNIIIQILATLGVAMQCLFIN